MNLQGVQIDVASGMGLLQKCFGTLEVPKGFLWVCRKSYPGFQGDSCGPRFSLHNIQGVQINVASGIGLLQKCFWTFKRSEKASLGPQGWA